MELKEYQTSTLDRLEEFLLRLREREEDAREYEEFQKQKGKKPIKVDSCNQAWLAIKEEGLLPPPSSEQRWIVRKDGLDRSIPHVCLKVPTGGGKTLLATESIGKISSQYLQKQTGLVLWIVPSDAIYQQTIKRFRDRNHSYRHSLEKASGGRTKILEKHNLFTPQDINDYLCVMVVMLQSSNRKTKEQLRMFRDSSGFMQFFPDVDDSEKNMALYRAVPNLDLLSSNGGSKTCTIKQSLGNTLRLIRPIIVLDEGHRAYGAEAKKTINSFNPSFILELSATPNAKAHQSNLLVDISGKDLKREQMIKLPICLENLQRADWKFTLSDANKRLQSLTKKANQLYEREGRYIRPIMLIRVDRTGKGKHHPKLVHADQVVEYLLKNIGVRRDEIKIKSASIDELKDEDLHSPFSKTKFIITKDALREGWDCSFAYILTTLSKTAAKTALTQMIGRILRQPHAQETGIEQLDQCFIFCSDQDVSQAIKSIKNGLMQEGLDDLSQQVEIIGGSSRDKSTHVAQTRKVSRRKEFRGTQFFIPRITTKNLDGNWRVFDYERDILANIDWEEFAFKDTSEFSLMESIKRTLTSIDISDKKNEVVFESFASSEVSTINIGSGLDLSYLTRHIMDVVPNPWQAARITQEALSACYKLGRTALDLYPVRLDLAESIKRHISKQVDEISENLFRSMLRDGTIQFQLKEQYVDGLDWPVPDDLQINNEEKILRRKSGEHLQKGLFEEYSESEFNELERDVAIYIDQESAIRWWHRLVAKKEGEYALSGWQKKKVYPDLLICVRKGKSNKSQYLVLETKGDFLAENTDSKYKKQLFDLLNESQKGVLESGEFVFENLDKSITFRMLMSDGWKNKLSNILKRKNN